MLITRATLLDETAADIRVGQLIEAVSDNLEPLPGEDVVDAAFGTVIPGLHDHHVHVRSAAAAFGSVRVGPPEVRSKSDMARALAIAPLDADGWIRAIGYHDSVAGPLNRASLDALSPSVPVRVQHRSGVSWTFNSAALARVGLPHSTDGHVHRTDPLPRPIPPRRMSLHEVSEKLAAWGVSGVTDATPDYTSADVESLSMTKQSGEWLQRLHCMAPPEVEECPGSTLGPTKRILEDDGLDLDELQRWIARCHDSARPVAIHSVTAAQLVVTMAALGAAGAHPRDRIEHAAVVPSDCLDDLAALGVTVVTQPNFIAERGDQYLVDVPPEDHEQLWRVGSLRRAGVPVALSTDMPFGHGDPWATMRAAATRRTPSGVTLGASERVTHTDSLAMFLGEPDRPAVPRSVTPGEPGDLCVLSVPPAEALARLDSSSVVTTIVGGQPIWTRGARSTGH